MKLLSIPSDIASYLTPDEKMIKIGRSREWEIYVTNKRFVFRKGGMFGKEIVEASYRHISSIEYKKESPWGYIVAGIVFIGIAFITNNLFSSIFEELGSIMGLVFAVFIGLIGIILLVAGVFITPSFKIHVVGRKPLTISGELEGIIRIIRQYREKVDAEITKRE